MKAVAILNIKGGVGKSTIAFNLAHAIERHNRSVLLVDLDMQSNLTDMAVSQPERITYSVYDLMTDDTVLPPNCVYPTVIPNVDIIPADLRLFDIQQVLNPSPTHWLCFNPGLPENSILTTMLSSIADRKSACSL